MLWVVTGLSHELDGTVLIRASLAWTHGHAKFATPEASNHDSPLKRGQKRCMVRCNKDTVRNPVVSQFENSKTIQL